MPPSVKSREFGSNIFKRLQGACKNLRDAGHGGVLQGTLKLCRLSILEGSTGVPPSCVKVMPTIGQRAGADVSDLSPAALRLPPYGPASSLADREGSLLLANAGQLQDRYEQTPAGEPCGPAERNRLSPSVRSSRVTAAEADRPTNSSCPLRFLSCLAQRTVWLEKDNDEQRCAR